MLNLLSIEVYILHLSFHHLKLLRSPLSERVNLNGKKKVEFVKMIHEKARLNIERRTK